VKCDFLGDAIFSERLFLLRGILLALWIFWRRFFQYVQMVGVAIAMNLWGALHFYS
jgi:hypothetical protein